MFKKRLLTPGPVSAYPPGLWAALDGNIHHRTAEFKAILSDVHDRLLRIMGNPEEVHILGSSGTGGMEAAVANFFSPGEPVLVGTCGKFGERWTELCRRFELQTVVHEFSYGTAVDPLAVEEALRRNPGTKGVFVQACESSTGVQNDIEAIAKVVSQTGALLIVDAISALATMPLSFQKDIDVLVGASQKALMTPPGLAFVAVGSKARTRMNQAKCSRYYFDLRASQKAWEQNGQTSFTPPTSLILSLQKSLAAIEDFGLERLIQSTQNRAEATRAGLAALPLEVFAQRPANALTAVVAPPIGADKITAELKQKYGMQVAGGQGELKGKIFRISHMGFIDHFDALGILSALELTLQSAGIPVETGKSLQAFQRAFAGAR